MSEPSSADPKRHWPDHLTDREIRRSGFDRFAGAASEYVSRPWLFILCLLLVLLWAPSIVAIGDIDTWQLIINTMTTIVTFLLVALLQNSQRRSEEAIHQKLNALARGIEDILEHKGGHDPGDVEKDIKDLRAAVGLEEAQ